MRNSRGKLVFFFSISNLYCSSHIVKLHTWAYFGDSTVVYIQRKAYHPDPNNNRVNCTGDWWAFIYNNIRPIFLPSHPQENNRRERKDETPQMSNIIISMQSLHFPFVWDVKYSSVSSLPWYTYVYTHTGENYMILNAGTCSHPRVSAGEFTACNPYYTSVIIYRPMKHRWDYTDSLTLMLSAWFLHCASTWHVQGGT